MNPCRSPSMPKLLRTGPGWAALAVTVGTSPWLPLTPGARWAS